MLPFTENRPEARKERGKNCGITEDEDNENDEQNYLYECPYCGKKYASLGAFTNHLEYGNHTPLRERETITDSAVKAYKKALEGSCRTSILVYNELRTLLNSTVCSHQSYKI